MENCCDLAAKHKEPVAHVHFADGVEAHNLIQVKEEGDNKIHAHIGFLQTNHKYEIKFDIPNLVGSNISATEKITKDVELTVVSVQPTDSTNTNLHILIHLFLVKKGLFKGFFTLEDENKKEVTVVIHARILGKHTGTPMLKDGIHCLEVIKDGQSDTELT